MKEYILIIGFGKSGKWAYNLGVKWGYMPIVYDDEFMNIESIEKVLKEISFAVVSPGVNDNHQLVVKLKEFAIPIMSEVEFAYFFRNIESKIIGVTGTNGKTTVVRMIQTLLQDKCSVAGNIGVPYSKIVGTEKENVVLELSSFQLEHIRTFTPDIAVFTNFAPDHIDYHGSFENYIRAKLKLLKNHSRNMKVIYCADDKCLRAEIDKLKAIDTFYYSLTKQKGNGIYCDGDQVVIEIDGKMINLFTVRDLGEVTSHYLQNVLVSSLVAYLLGEEIVHFLPRLRMFVPSPYREQIVENSLGIKIINNSKATNLMATLSAIESMGRSSIHLIVGGRGKREDYSQLFKYDNVKSVVAFGESRLEFMTCAEKNGYKTITITKTMEDATKVALSQVRKGEVLLFSPCCSSFDQFRSYEERGDKFNEIVKEIESSILISKTKST